MSLTNVTLFKVEARVRTPLGLRRKRQVRLLEPGNAIGDLVLWAKSGPNTHPPERLVLAPASAAAGFLVRPIAPA